MPTRRRHDRHATAGHPSLLTPELLTELIDAMHPGIRVTEVAVIESVGIGHKVSTAGRAKLRLSYAPGSPICRASGRWDGSAA